MAIKSGSNDKKGVWDRVKLFSSETTLHGFAFALGERPHYNRYKWKNVLYLAAILCCLTVTGNNLYYLISEYYEYPVTTSIVVDHKSVLPYPALTICNCNKFPEDDYFKDVNTSVSYFTFILCCI